MIRTFLIVLVVVAVLNLSTTSQRKQQSPPTPVNRPPVISRFESSAPSIGKCVDTSDAYYDRCPPASRKAVTLVVAASDPDGDELTYEYTSTAGELFGKGSVVSWRLFEQGRGEYTATVKVADSKGASATAAVKVKVMDCPNCLIGEPPCPLLSIVAEDPSTLRGESLFLRVEITSGYFRNRPDFIWTVTNARVLRGQHSQIIELLVTGDPGTNVSARVVVEGLEAYCSNEVAKSVPIKDDVFGPLVR